MFEVWDTNNTLYDRTDDGVERTTPNATSGPCSARSVQRYDDGRPCRVGRRLECRRFTNTPYNDARDYHNNWYLLYSGMTGGVNGPKIYRVHTTSTDPASPSQQLVADGANSFALYASATGGTPKLYGLGAMQAFTPLEDNRWRRRGLRVLPCPDRRGACHEDRRDPAVGPG